MRRALFLIVLALLMASPAPGRRAPAHKFHVSFSEADYNGEERSLQVSLRTFPDDLENILGRRAGRRVALDGGRETGRLILDYLREVFRLLDARGEPAPLSWVGMEASVDTVWLYFEAKLPGGLKGARLSNRFLQDLFDDQLNKTSVKAAGRKISLTFRPGDGFKSLDAK